MKHIILFIIGMFTYAMGGVLGIAEFVLYTTKKDPVNWWVVTPFIFGLVLMTVYFPYNIQKKQK